jgi:hypothetical protein
MNRDDVTKAQAKRIYAALWSSANYLARLRRRMEQRRFPHVDPLYVRVCATNEELNRLMMDLHYLSCDGVGRPAEDDGEKPPF